MFRILLALIALPLSFPAWSQTFTAGGAAIPDDGTTVDLPISIAGLPSIDTTAFGLETVCLNATHTWISDFEISLVAPDGTTVLLLNGIGWDTDEFTNTCLNSDATTNIADGTPPFSGIFRPQGQMGIVNNGQDPNGIWQLRVRDTYPFADAGTVLDFALTFGNAPAGYFALQSSELPIVIISTNNMAIPDEPKIPGTIGIIDNGPGNLNFPTDPFNDFNGGIGIELRGSSSQSIMAKKSYGVELWDTLGNEQEAPLLGMPTETDWVLLANFSDKSLLNNTITFDLAQRMGHYAARWRHVELILNGQYAGVYVLCEKIKRDGDRVDIAKLLPADTIGDDLTGGYLFKIDKTTGSFTGGWYSDFEPISTDNGQQVLFQFEYPGEPLPQQAAYIEAYVDSFETALFGPQFDDPVDGYRPFVDLGSFIDHLLILELSRNVDGYRLSTYLHKDKDSNGGRLTFGPLWDFDLAYANADYCRGADVTGWAYDFAYDCPDDGYQAPAWWQRFQEDSSFVNEVRCRWEQVRDDVLGVARLHAWIDSMALVLDDAQQHNFTVWPILGTWVWPNPQPVPPDYAGEVQEMKDWISARWQWMDENLPGECLGAGTATVLKPEDVRAFPDPFTDHFFVELPGSISSSSLELTDALGRRIPLRVSSGAGSRHLVVPGTGQAGLYVLSLGTGTSTVRIPLIRMAD